MTVKRKSVLLFITSVNVDDTVTIGSPGAPLPEPIAQYAISKKLYRVPEGAVINAIPGADHTVTVYAGFSNNSPSELITAGTGQSYSFSVYGESMSILFYDK